LYAKASVLPMAGGKLLRELQRSGAVAGGPPRCELRLRIGVVIPL